jgi:ABC-type transporter Mla subunit MlaD
MNRERRIGLGVLAAVALVALLVSGVLIAREARNLRFTVVFKDARDLKAGDRVQISGVDVGVVREVILHTQPTRIDVKVRVDAEHAEKVRADATARIGSTAFPNVSGQKVLEIVNSETDPPYPPMEQDAVIEGMDNAIQLGAWQVKKKFEGSKETWVRRLDLARDGVKRAMEDVKELRENPELKGALEQLQGFLKKMRDGGKDKIDQLMEEWGPLKERVMPMLKQLNEMGRKYLSDQLQQIMKQIEETLESWRGVVEGARKPAAEPAGEEGTTGTETGG